MPFFVDLGYPCHALSLRGHGASEGRAGIRWHALADYVADLATSIAALPESPVIIAHSMGAFVVQRYLERHRAPAVILLTPMPVTGTATWLVRQIIRHPGAALRSILTLNSQYIVGAPLTLAHESFFSADLPVADLARHAARLQPESFRVALESFLPQRLHSQPGMPVLVLAAAEDRVFTRAEVTATARAWNAELAVLPGLAHDMMLDTRWEHAAVHVAHWLARTVNPELAQV